MFISTGGVECLRIRSYFNVSKAKAHSDWLSLSTLTRDFVGAPSSVQPQDIEDRVSHDIQDSRLA